MNIHRILLFAGAALVFAVLTAAPTVAATATPQPGEHQMMQRASHPMDTDTPVCIGPEALRQIQAKLSESGDYVGAVDGIWGKATASALKHFQQSRSLAPTGTLTIETIQALNLPNILTGDTIAQAETAPTEQMAAIGGAQLYISPSGLEQVQQSLLNQGLAVGKVDGAWGKRTQLAIREFQSKNGMSPTGHVSPALLSRLGINEVVAALSPEQEAGAPEDMAQTARGYYGKASQGVAQNSTMQNHPMIHGRGVALFADADMIARIQKALSDAGYDPGQPDGTWRASSAKALARYQKAEKMAPTGTLTLASIKKLVGGF